jgi:peptidoglycan/LPS O-acetylase OafA/YrhL
LSQPKNLEIDALIAGLAVLNYRVIEMPLRKKGARSSLIL